MKQDLITCEQMIANPELWDQINSAVKYFHCCSYLDGLKVGDKAVIVSHSKRILEIAEVVSKSNLSVKVKYTGDFKKAKTETFRISDCLKWGSTPYSRCSELHTYDEAVISQKRECEKYQDHLKQVERLTNTKASLLRSYLDTRHHDTAIIDKLFEQLPEGAKNGL